MIFTTALVFFLILSILVFAHELGHFLVARFIGVRVDEFGFGLPPRLWGKKIGETIYSVNWLPIGGFVKLAGEEEEEDKRIKGVKRQEYFWARSKKERAAILLAGVTMNFILAVGITTYLLTQGVHEASGRVHIERVSKDSPAQKAGLQTKDIIQMVAYQQSGVMQEKQLSKPQDLIDITRSHRGEEVRLTVKREEKTFTVSLIPRKEYPKGEGPMGVSISDLELKKYSLSEAPGKALVITLDRGWQMLASIGGMVWKLLTLQPVGADVAGPIGIAQVTGEAVKFGFRAVLEFMSILSLNLAILNALPIPALDGGRLLFVFLEKIIGRRFRPAFERSTHQIGMAVLLALMLLISINDILRLARGG